VVVDRVLPRSPADRGGLDVGDVVRAVNGRTISDAEELRYLFATLPVGDKAQVQVWRAGKEQTLSLPLEAPADDPPRKQTAVEGMNPLAGAVIANLNPALAEELGREYAEPGVIVLEVPPQSIAARMRFQSGDRLMEINGAALKSVDDVMKATAKPQNGWMVTLNRNGRTLQFTIGG
jgi:S1-C subfamily serine protease